MQQRQHAVGAVVAEAPEQLGVHVADLDVGAGLAERVGDPAPGAQGHVALVGEAAGEDQDAGGRRGAGRDHGFSSVAHQVRSLVGPS